MSDIYYKIYLTREEEIAIVCLQSLDEQDYIENRFLSEEKFKSEEDAIEFILEARKRVGIPIKIRQAIDIYLDSYSIIYKNCLD